MRKPCKNMRIKEAIKICEDNPRKYTFDHYYNDTREHVKICLEKLSEIYGCKDETIKYKIVDADLTEKILCSNGNCFYTIY